MEKPQAQVFLRYLFNILNHGFLMMGLGFDRKTIASTRGRAYAAPRASYA